MKGLAFPGNNSNPHIPGIPAGDVLNKDSLPSSLSHFHWQRWQDELSYLINFFVGDQPIIQREMEGSDEGEVSLKEVKDMLDQQHPCCFCPLLREIPTSTLWAVS